MYFFYFDESGSRDPRAFGARPDGSVQAKDHIYSLTAIGLWEGRWRGFEREIANLKLQFTDQLNRTGKLHLDPADCEMKSNWIRNPKERADRSPFLTALSSDERERLVACFFRQVPVQRMTLFSVVVDKRKLREYLTPETLHKKAYELSLERIEHFMANSTRNTMRLLLWMTPTGRSIGRCRSNTHFSSGRGTKTSGLTTLSSIPFSRTANCQMASNSRTCVPTTCIVHSK
jgi:hypothetical protein